jgi:hypothetical protein
MEHYRIISPDSNFGDKPLGSHTQMCTPARGRDHTKIRG